MGIIKKIGKAVGKAVQQTRPLIGAAAGFAIGGPAGAALGAGAASLKKKDLKTVVKALSSPKSLVAGAAGFLIAGPTGAAIGAGLGAGSSYSESSKKLKGQRASAMADREASSIQEQGRRADAERSRINQESAAAKNKISMGRRVANRRRVRGGLFGDSSVDQNVQAKLG